jgi:hypothetical protein
MSCWFRPVSRSSKKSEKLGGIEPRRIELILGVHLVHQYDFLSTLSRFQSKSWESSLAHILLSCPTSKIIIWEGVATGCSLYFDT